MCHSSGEAGATPLHYDYPPGMSLVGVLPYPTLHSTHAPHVMDMSSLTNYWSYLMSANATTRMTVGTLLGAVNGAATTVADTFDTATKAIGMANLYVTTMSDKQRIRTKLEMHTFVNKLAEETAMVETLRKKNIEEFCKDEQNAEIYNTEYEKIVAILAKS